MNNSKKFQFGNVLTISFAHLVHDIYSSFLAPILPLLIDKLSISYSLAGLLSVIQRVPSLFNPLVGILADRISLRYFIIIAPSITAVSMSLLGAAPHYTALSILLFIMGVSAALFHVPAPVMIRRVAGHRIGKGMSFFMFGGEIARSLGPLIILGGVSLWGLEGTYRLIPFGLLASLILYFKFKDINISEDFIKKKKESGINQAFKKVLPMFINITGITFFTSIMKGTMTVFLPTYLTDQGESLWFAGIALSVLQLAGAVGTFLSGTISDRIGRRTTLMVMAIATPVLLLLFLELRGIYTFPILILIGLFLFGATPVLLAVVNAIDSDRPSFINSIYMTINFVIGAVSVMLVGVLGDFIGLELTYYLSAVLALGAIPFILKLSGRN